MRRFSVLFVILLLCSLLVLPVSAQTTEFDGYLVKLSDVAPRMFSHGSLDDILVVDTLEEALAMPEEFVEYIEPNYRVYLFAEEETSEEQDWPNDPLYATHQLGLQAINGLAACEYGLTGNGVLVGVIDSGVLASHEDLNGENISGVTFATDGLSYTVDSQKHGSIVTGVIAAQTNNGLGIAGITPDVKVRAYRCFGENSYTVAQILPGIQQAIDDGCQVINCSFGMANESKFFREMVDEALDAGIIVVAAVGNDGDTALKYPAAYPGVIGVGAVNSNLKVWYDSQRNESVFVTAPGQAITGIHYAQSDEYLQGLSGTSFSAPVVTAMAAAALDYDDDITADGIRYLLQTTAIDCGKPGYDTTYGWGVVDVEAFLKELQRPFTIMYELNGGELTGRVPTDYEVTDDQLVLPEAQRIGYTFLGWYADEDLEQPVDCIPAGSVGDKTFYAGWEKIVHPLIGSYLSELPEYVCADLNLWSILDPDPLYYTANGWEAHHSGSVSSVTIPVTAGEKIAATSFGPYPANGSAADNENGISVTFFDETGICMMLTSQQTYAEYMENGGYLVVPEGAVAVNIPMWNDSDENELYLLEREHRFSDYDRYDPETGASAAVCDGGCGATDIRSVHAEPQWSWNETGLAGEDYGTGQVLLALFDQDKRMLAVDFCEGEAVDQVGDTVIFRYTPPQFSGEVLRKTAYLVRFSLNLDGSFIPLMQSILFD